MKTHSLLILALLFACTPILAQTGKAEFKESSYDFGTIPEDGGDVTHVFQFTNTGDVPVVIQRVSTSCGCTASEWTKEPVLPGKTGTVAATYSPLGRPYAFTKTLTVRTNGEPQTIVLFIRGTVTPRERTPQEIYRQKYGNLGLQTNYLSVGRVPHNGFIDYEVPVYNFGDQPITVSLGDIPSYAKVSPKRVKLAPNTKSAFTLTVDGAKLDDWGLISAQLSLKYDKQNAPLTLSFSREEDFSALSAEERANAPRMSVDKKRIDFGNVKQGEVIKLEFTLTNSGKSNLLIRKIVSNCGCLTALSGSQELKPGESSTLKVEFTSQGYSGRQSKQITVITNDPTMPTLLLQVMGYVQ